MKTQLIPFALLIISATTGCNNSGASGDTQVKDKDTSVTASTGNTHHKRVKSTKAVEASPSVQTSFTAKYPAATDVEWTKFDEAVQPVDFDWDLTDWALPDTTIYTAAYTIDTTDYWSWYTPSGNWIGTVSTIPNNSNLPDAVNQTLQTQFDGYTVTSITKENDKNRTAYEIKMRKGDDKMKALIDENGTLMKKKGKESGQKIKEKNV